MESIYDDTPDHAGPMGRPRRGRGTRGVWAGVRAPAPHAVDRHLHDQEAGGSARTEGVRAAGQARRADAGRPGAVSPRQVVARRRGPHRTLGRGARARLGGGSAARGRRHLPDLAAAPRTRRLRARAPRHPHRTDRGRARRRRRSDHRRPGRFRHRHARAGRLPRRRPDAGALRLRGRTVAPTAPVGPARRTGRPARPPSPRRARFGRASQLALAAG